MKNKIKGFFKKIKNWLSSLSKWAKKYYKMLLMALLCGLLVISMVFTTNRNKKSASAQVLYSNDMVLTLSPFLFENADGTSLYTLPFYIGNDNSLGLYIDVPYSNGWESGNFVYERHYFTHNDTYTSFITNNIDFMVRTVSNTNMWFYSRDINGNSKSNVEIIANTYNSFNGNLVEWVFYNTNYYTVNCLDHYFYDNGVLTHDYSFDFYFYNIDNERVCDIKISNTLGLTIQYNVINTVPLFISSHTNRVAVADELLHNSYTNGYNIGYIKGYDNGFNYGVQYSSDPDNFRPFKLLVQSIDDFFSVPILGDITLATFLYLGLGVLVLSILVKVVL